MDGGDPHDALARRVAGRTLTATAGPPLRARASPLARLAAFAALGLAVVGVLLVDRSDAGCRFDSEAGDHVGALNEPGATAGPFAFLLAPLLAGAALVALLRRPGETGPRPRAPLALAAALSAYPVAGLALMLYLAKGAFACGLF